MWNKRGFTLQNFLKEKLDRCAFLNFLLTKRLFKFRWVKKKNLGGFTLIELMVVTIVLSIGIIGAMNSIGQVFIYARLLSSRLTAAYLAQEGIEIVRNIRDTNWLEGVAWDDGIATGDFEADYDDSGLSFYGNRYLRIGGGFYNYGLGEETKFKRRINIQKDTAEISVLVIVTWQERGQEYRIEVFEKLYNWR